MNDRQKLLALHSLIPWPWPRFNQISTFLANNLQDHLPTIVKENYRTASLFPFESYYAASDVAVVTYLDPDYPPLLKELHDPPAVLYLRGNKQLLTNSMLAIIGSRKATSYTHDIIDYFMPQFKAADLTICSGLAIGADTHAHKIAIEHGVNTVAVIGSGFHYPYPKQNIALFSELAKNHLLVTEYPPNTPPQPHQFIARNRVISALSKGIFITEAELKSGTMSTVDFALDLGKEVYTVPGSIFSTLSSGPHSLVQQGATLVHSSEDFSEQILPRSKALK